MYLNSTHDYYVVVVDIADDVIMIIIIIAVVVNITNAAIVVYEHVYNIDHVVLCAIVCGICICCV